MYCDLIVFSFLNKEYIIVIGLYVTFISFFDKKNFEAIKVPTSNISCGRDFI